VADVDVDAWLHEMTTGADLSTEPLSASTTSPPGLCCQYNFSKTIWHSFYCSAFNFL
jgi:hypothetical protein